jgi:dipeptidyl aminopeptidase/acylaminoacyl peptidase
MTNTFMSRLGVSLAVGFWSLGFLCAQDSPQRGTREERNRPPVYKERITPFWFHNNTRFWYANDLRNGTEFVVVDAEKGTRQLAFDHAKVAAALSKAAGVEYKAERLPFERIEFVDDTRAIRFTVGDQTWKCDLSSYHCEKTRPGTSVPAARETGGPRERRRSGTREREPEPSARSPDGKWTAFIKDHNLFVRSEKEEVQLSQDGKEGLGYGRFTWSADSKTLVAFRIEPGERKEVYLIESSPAEGGRAKLRTRPYDLPGDKFTKYELNLFDVAGKNQSKPEVDRFEHGWLRPRLHWKGDGRHFAYEQADRGHQRFRLIEVDSQTGTTRNLVDEKSETFIWTAHTENLGVSLVTWLKSDEVIYVSERDGWRHLYLIGTNGAMTQITRGEWVVRGIDRIDEEKRQIWFRASSKSYGRSPGDEDPYFIHYYRVNFDGTDFVALTEGNGHHLIDPSPDWQYYIDTWSRVDMAPIHELRRADGTRVLELEKADIADLKGQGWKPPEVFVAKGRDGKTDIWGLICRPREFDPNRKYPVIEDIYAGPQGSFVPKTFSARSRYQALNDLGFIVVKIDGMGTANRSKAFHDVCWKNLKDAGFPDRILWMKAAAAKHPQLDLTRVGVYGNSAGGQNAAGAVLFHPEFYKVAVASCGCHDNRMDKASWNEQWMGYPVGPQYSECSNIDNAHRLRGKLFLIVGEMDENVPPESTMRFVDALIKAGKDFDLLVVPGGGHGMGGAYGQRRMQDFFVRHLLGTEPPNRNGEQLQTSASGHGQ